MQHEAPFVTGSVRSCDPTVEAFESRAAPTLELKGAPRMNEGPSTQPSRSNLKVEVKLQTLYEKMEKLHRRELSKWWEVESLQRYIEVERVPRGLRIYTVPTYEDPDPEMLEEWAENSKQSSLNMMRILTKYAMKDRSRTLEEMEKVRLEILALITQETFDEYMKYLEKKLCKFEEEITAKKQRKFIRDFKDYQAGRILTFQRKYDHMYNEEATELNSRDSEQISQPIEEQEESDISDGNLSDVSDTALAGAPASDKEVDRLNFLKQFRLLNQGRMDQHKGAHPQRGRGRGVRGRGRGTDRPRRGGAGDDTRPQGMITRARKRKL
ncbi:hypothetical protein NDU88_002902 [Pleurodeles waltl]|uniref:Uncharacterized protein n=1 Tax=Pleurodeles waltl TaxID=8319 RepID=A0AAV7TMJ1_PLEWA|nr:hypothetical protein NDU88_002902 [Pleurodeles waltl]